MSVDYRRVLLPASEHRHEVGEDRSRCPNCIVNAAGAEMSAFEVAAWDWYFDHASGWAARVGITAEEFIRLRLTGIKRELFIKAMQMIEGEIGKALDDKE